MVHRGIEFVGAMIILFWVVTHAQQFNQVTTSLMNATRSGVQTIWGG